MMTFQITLLYKSYFTFTIFKRRGDRRSSAPRPLMKVPLNMTSRNHHRITIAYQSHRRLSCEIICLILSNIWLQLCMCRSTVTITSPDDLTATSRTRMAATAVNRPFLFHQIWSQRVLVLSVMHRCARKRGKTVSPTRPPFQSMGSYRKLFLFQFYASLMRRHVWSPFE